ncbi:MAG: 2Fe-2S iron-sulfur cluster-binding protein [Thermoplasmata archaeon]
MSNEFFEIKIYRVLGELKENKYITYKIPRRDVETILDALDYIRHNLDSSLGYYSHQACGKGMCGTCTVKANGKPVLACQTKIEDKMIIEPVNKNKIVVDLVSKM